jgi:FAD/FMN-containing dehydrogenase
VSGLTLGGGVGVVCRKYGLTCDSLTAAQIVTADGSVIAVDDRRHDDLLWALRGGGGSFGVVTQLRFDYVPATTLAHAFVMWPWSAATDVLAAWQRWAVAAPDSVWSACHILATDDKSGAPTVAVPAVLVGSTAQLQQHIGELTQQISTPPTTNFVTSESWAATMLLEAGCSQLSVQQCHVDDETPGGTLPRDAFVAGSDFFADPIPRAGIDALINAVEHRQADPRLGGGGASFDILGGAIDRVPDSHGAWSHRGALFNAQYTASWGKASSNQPLARNQHSLAKLRNTVHRYARGDAYQNYADDSLRNPQQAYYGANLAKLIEIRRTYDPGALFTQPQGVPNH